MAFFKRTRFKNGSAGGDKRSSSPLPGRMQPHQTLDIEQSSPGGDGRNPGNRQGSAGLVSRVSLRHSTMNPGMRPTNRQSQTITEHKRRIRNSATPRPRLYSNTPPVQAPPAPPLAAPSSPANSRSQHDNSSHCSYDSDYKQPIVVEAPLESLPWQMIGMGVMLDSDDRGRAPLPNNVHPQPPPPPPSVSKYPQQELQQPPQTHHRPNSSTFLSDNGHFASNHQHHNRPAAFPSLLEKSPNNSSGGGTFSPYHAQQQKLKLQQQQNKSRASPPPPPLLSPQQQRPNASPPPPPLPPQNNHHPSDNNDNTNTASNFDSNNIMDRSGALMIEVSPGVSKPLRGSEETWKAIEEGRVTITSCISCQIDLNCVEDAELVVCPECTMISPVDQTTTIPEHAATPSQKYGVGVGIKPEAVREWVRSSIR